MMGQRKRADALFFLPPANLGGYRIRVNSLARRFTLILLPLAALLAAGCLKAVELPPQVTVAQIVPSGRPAKGPNCNMPVLRADPPTDFKRVALIEGLGSVYAHERDVLPVVRSKACETGADAIIILESRAQTGENMTGYYIDAEAIIYEHGHNLITASPTPTP